ncbi:MAG TPA: F0F1 ATP synthase subunit delta [Candidatus Binatia bacterium]|nr:F0F1 ATP synthase subunit delta [Candidatus Binatia bacterium]
MKIPKQAKRKAKALFKEVHANGLLDENRLVQAVQLTSQRKPRGYLAILTHLEHLVKLDVENRTARIESATPLDGQVEAAVKEKLARHYGPGLHTSFHVNAALLGGLRIRVGSDVYDGTVAGRLKQLEDELAQ